MAIMVNNNWYKIFKDENQAGQWAIDNWQLAMGNLPRVISF